MELEHAKYTVISVDYGDLETLIQRELPQFADYSIIADNEWHNYASYEVNVQPLLKLHDSDDIRMIVDILNGKTGNHDWDKFPTWGILSALCELGSIEAGTYLIDVCW